MTVPAGQGALESTQQQVLTQLQTGGSSTITANAGTNLNTSALALESGGNLASAKADLDTIVTQTSGLATQSTLSSVKSDLDTIVTQTATPNVSDRWARQVGQVDVARVLGSALSQGNPVIVENNILNWIRNGQGFVAGPTQQTSGGTFSVGFSLWNGASSGKTVLIYALRVGLQTSNYSSMYLTTSNPALTNTISTPSNSKPGSGISSVATVTWQNTTTSSSGTFFEQIITPGSAITEMISSSEEIELVPGNGLLLLIPTASSNWTVVCKWVEF